jgi:hypothetical protein
MTTCNLPPPPPKKPAPCYARASTKKPPPPPCPVVIPTSQDMPKLQGNVTHESQDSSQHTQTVVIQVQPPAQLTPRQERRPVWGPGGTTKWRRTAQRTRYNLGILAGMSPTQHTVSATSCDVSKQQCQVDVKRKYVADFGVQATAVLSSGLQLGAQATAQGSIYGIIGFSF